MALCCPCFTLARIKAALDIRAGTLTSKFMLNVVIIGVINIWQLQRLWLPLVPGGTTENCSFSEYFSDVGLAGEGSIVRCSQTKLGDFGGMLQLGSYVWLIVLVGRVRQEYRQRLSLGVSERCGEAEDFVLSCCCQSCTIAQMDRDMRQQALIERGWPGHGGGGGGAADLETGANDGTATALHGFCDCSPDACAAQFRDPTKPPHSSGGDANAKVGVERVGGPSSVAASDAGGMRGTIELAGLGVVRSPPGTAPAGQPQVALMRQAQSQVVVQAQPQMVA